MPVCHRPRSRATACTDLPFAIARFFHCEPDHEQALAHGLAAVREYPQRMGVRFGGGGMPPMFEPDASDAVILANAVIGDPAHCAERVDSLRRALGPHRLLLKPAVHDESGCEKPCRSSCGASCRPSASSPEGAL